MVKLHYKLQSALKQFSFDVLYCDTCGEHDALIGVYDPNNEYDAEAFAKYLFDEEYYSAYGIQAEVDRLFNCYVDVEALAQGNTDEEI